MPKPTGIVWSVSDSAGLNASRRLPDLARDYFQAGRDLVRAQASSAVFHKFRLKTKRFRYTLELFQPCYGPGLEQRLQALRHIQDLLGEINDCATTKKLLGRMTINISTYLDRRIEWKKRALRSYWRRVFDADGQETWWTDYLAHYARGARRS